MAQVKRGATRTVRINRSSGRGGSHTASRPYLPGLSASSLISGEVRVREQRVAGLVVLVTTIAASFTLIVTVYSSVATSCIEKFPASTSDHFYQEVYDKTPRRGNGYALLVG